MNRAMGSEPRYTDIHGGVFYCVCCAACVVDVVNADKIKMLKAFDFYFCIMSEISQVHKE